MSCFEYDFDDQGRILAGRLYPGECGAGEAFSCNEFDTDALGRVIEQRYDLGCDGRSVDRELITYDASNRVLSIRSDTTSEGGTETHCQLRTFVWSEVSDTDAVGTESADEGCDGSIDDSRYGCYEIGYDLAGHLVTYLEDQGCDGVREWCYTYEYDGLGRQVVVRHDTDCDGVPDTRSEHDYDGSGALLRTVDYDEETGAVERCGVATGDCRNVFQGGWRRYSKPVP